MLTWINVGADFVPYLLYRKTGNVTLQNAVADLRCLSITTQIVFQNVSDN
jgi:hypothetical protein